MPTPRLKRVYDPPASDDGKPYTTLGYMNGPGARMDEPRADLSGVDTTDLDFLQQALVPLGESETHAGDDVAILAQGPWAHLFHGVVEQNLIYHVMDQATGLATRAALAASIRAKVQPAAPAASQPS